MSLLKYSLIKVDQGLLYQLEFSNLRPFKQTYRVINADLNHQFTIDSGENNYSSISNQSWFIGSTRSSVNNRTKLVFFNSNKERDAYYKLYNQAIKQFIESYKTEFNIQ